jgi:phage terminase large subunit-like protein
MTNPSTLHEIEHPIIAGYDPDGTKGECWYDQDAAEMAVGFFRECLTHVKGEKAGQPFELDNWQENIISTIFGWKRQDNTRRFRTVYIEVPRKNGKSTLSAAIALFLLFSEGEPGAEIYSAAAEREQASIVFDIAAQMVAAEPVLRGCSKTFRKSIVKGASSYKVLSADAYTKHGLNASAIIFDELHAQPNRDLWDVLATSTGARTQPLTIAITTAGYDRNSICYEVHDYASKVRDGIIEDETFLPVIYGADEKDDFKDPATWKKANPGLGTSIRLDYLEIEAKKAAELPSYENTFRRLHLNQWTEQAIRWIPINRWDEADPFAAFGERAVYAGLDLASTTDIAALVMVAQDDEGGFDVMSRFWIPAENAHRRERKDRVPYEAWIREGLVTATPGDVIDYDQIREDILALTKEVNIKQIAVDRWNATQIVTQLDGELPAGTMVMFGQGYRSMSAPSKQLEALVMSRKLHHDNNPVMRWMASNCAIQTDPAGNIKPTKDEKKSTGKIDGIVALVMALARATADNDDGDSVYEDRGIIIL